MRALLLDRDGVLNADRADSVTKVEQLRVLPGAGDALRLAYEAGYRCIVVTNQACVGRGELTEAELERIHQSLDAALAQSGARIERYYVCTHRAEEHCACRKPQPGLLRQAQHDLSFGPAQTWFVGDSGRDAGAARAFGCRFALVRTGRGAHTEREGSYEEVHDDLLSFVRAHILST